MPSIKINERTKEAHLAILKKHGEDGLFKSAVSAAIMSSTSKQHTEIELLNISEGFLTLYRRTGDQNFITISKILRRAAHKVHRELFKLDKQGPSDRFLKLVG